MTAIISPEIIVGLATVGLSKDPMKKTVLKGREIQNRYYDLIRYQPGEFGRGVSDLGGA